MSDDEIRNLHDSKGLVKSLNNSKDNDEKGDSKTNIGEDEKASSSASVGKVAGTSDPGDSDSGNIDSIEDYVKNTDEGTDEDTEEDTDEGTDDDEWNDVGVPKIVAKLWPVQPGGRKCLRCGERHEDDSAEFWDCYYDFDSRAGYDENWNCLYIPFTDYLKDYSPENKVNSVESFLELGELCENLIEFTKTIERDGRSYFLENGNGPYGGYEEGHFDFELLESFRCKLKTVQEVCVIMTKEAVRKWIYSIGEKWKNLPELAIDLVFQNVFQAGEAWKEAETIGKFEENAEYDKVILNKTYAELSPIYVGFRSFGHGAYCDRHNNRGCDEPYLDEVESFKETWKKFQPDEFWINKKD